MPARSRASLPFDRGGDETPEAFRTGLRALD
jgi:hypothetical protein